MQRSSLIRLFFVLLFFSAGCTTAGLDRRDLHASDNDRLHPGARISFGILPRDEPLEPGLLELATRSGSTALDTPDTATKLEARAEGTDPVAPEMAADNPSKGESPRKLAQASLAIELDYRAGIGNDDQESIPGINYIDYDGIRIDGPTTLDQTFTLHLVTATLRGGVRLFDRLLVEAMAGIATSTLNFVVRTPTARTGNTSVGLGANGGGRITFFPHPVFGLYVQGQLNILGGLQQRHEAIFIPTLEVGSNLQLTRHLSVFGGWRWWQYSERIDRESDVDDIDVTGPTFGAALRF